MTEGLPRIEQIDWYHLSDVEIRKKLKDLLFEIHLSSTKMRSMDEAAVVDAIKLRFKEKGFPTEVAVTVSRPNAVGQRMVMGMAHSPSTGETISF